MLRTVSATALLAASIAVGSDAGVSGAGSPAVAPVLHVPILLYHRIVPAAEAGNSLPALVVPPQEFAGQMDALKAAGWHAVTATRLADYLQTSETPPARTFVVTIDDGTDDGYAYAYPILRERGFVASYFVVAGRIGHPHNMDAHQLRVLAAAGNEIANHSMSHAHLTRRTHAELTGEIDAASAAIAAITGQRPATFAYPFGERDADVAAAVGACRGLRMALTTTRGATETWTGRFEVPRIAVEPATRPADLLATMERAG
jgi:peptidoglycan/xylan/chitin deacetylase (PgdA/CDA1 family)